MLLWICMCEVRIDPIQATWTRRAPSGACGQPGGRTPVNGAAHVEFQRVGHARVCADVLVYLICVAPVHLHATNGPHRGIEQIQLVLSEQTER